MLLGEDGCLQVSYDPELATWASAIRSAAAAWSGVACNRLCLAPPIASTRPVSPGRWERRIHFALAGSPSLYADSSISPTSDGLMVPTTYFTNAPTAAGNGRILSAEVIVNRRPPVAIEPSDWLGALGGVLGLEVPAVGTDSILASFGTPRRITTLRPADEQAICTLYGTPSYCGE